MAEFYTILTSVGLAKLINAQLTSDAVTITEVAVGDSNGAYYEPTQSQTKLRKEVWRGRVASVTQDSTNSNWIITEVAIPADDGNFTIREVGVFDQNGDLIAIGKYPQTYKPIATNGSVKDLIIRLILEINNINSVNIQIDPTVAIASRKYVNEKVDEAMNQNLKENAKNEMFPSLNVIDLEGMTVGDIVLVESNVKIGNIILA